MYIYICIIYIYICVYQDMYIYISRYVYIYITCSYLFLVTKNSTASMGAQHRQLKLEAKMPRWVDTWWSSSNGVSRFSDFVVLRKEDFPGEQS